MVCERRWICDGTWDCLPNCVDVHAMISLCAVIGFFFDANWAFSGTLAGVQVVVKQCNQHLERNRNINSAKEKQSDVCFGTLASRCCVFSVEKDVPEN